MCTACVRLNICQKKILQTPINHLVLEPTLLPQNPSVICLNTDGFKSWLTEMLRKETTEQSEVNQEF